MVPDQPYLSDKCVSCFIRSLLAVSFALVILAGIPPALRPGDRPALEEVYVLWDPHPMHTSCVPHHSSSLLCCCCRSLGRVRLILWGQQISSLALRSPLCGMCVCLWTWVLLKPQAFRLLKVQNLYFVVFLFPVAFPSWLSSVGSSTFPK